MSRSGQARWLFENPEALESLGRGPRETDKRPSSKKMLNAAKEFGNKNSHTQQDILVLMKVVDQLQALFKQDPEKAAEWLLIPRDILRRVGFLFVMQGRAKESASLLI